MPATTAQQGTLTHNFIPFYLVEGSYLLKSAATLLAMRGKRKNGPERHALWEGHYAVKCEAEKFVEALRERGGILFLGSPAALAAAQAAEDARNAARAAA